MRGNDLLNKMELIDPAYVEAANTKTVKIKSAFVKWGAVAACLSLAIVSAFVMKGAWTTRGGAGTDVPMLNTNDTPRYNEEHGDTEIVTEILIEPATDNAAFLPFIPSDGPHSSDSVDVTPLISSWGESVYVCDMSVSDGEVFLSDSLTSAMEHYGDTANYRVLVELFDDGVQISSGGQLAIKECERLSDLGYIVAMETVTQTEDNGEYMTTHVTYYFTLHATLEQIKSFTASEQLGYSLMLYGEYFGDAEVEETVIFNGSMQGAN